MAILFDVITEISTDIYQTDKYSYQSLEQTQVTNNISPNISPQYSMVHAPVLQFNSPNGSIGASPISQTPAVSPITSVIPTATAEQITKQSDEADLGDVLGGGGSGMMDMLMLGVLAIAAIFLIPMFLKKKKK